MAGEHLDLSSDPPSGNVPQQGGPTGDTAGTRPYVGVQFDCCDVYHRIYINRDQTAYTGHCPRCAKPIRLKVGPGGTSARIFRAS